MQIKTVTEGRLLFVFNPSRQWKPKKLLSIDHRGLATAVVYHIDTWCRRKNSNTWRSSEPYPCSHWRPPMILSWGEHFHVGTKQKHRFKALYKTRPESPCGFKHDSQVTHPPKIMSMETISWTGIHWILQVGIKTWRLFDTNVKFSAPAHRRNNGDHQNTIGINWWPQHLAIARGPSIIFSRPSHVKRTWNRSYMFTNCFYVQKTLDKKWNSENLADH